MMAPESGTPCMRIEDQNTWTSKVHIQCEETIPGCQDVHFFKTSNSWAYCTGLLT